MASSEKLFDLYQKLYAQRAVLTAAPALTLDPAKSTPADFPTDEAKNQIKGVMNYLMSVKDVDALPYDQAVARIDAAYHDQEFWRDVLMDYLNLNRAEKQAPAASAPAPALPTLDTAPDKGADDIAPLPESKPAGAHEDLLLENSDLQRRTKDVLEKIQTLETARQTDIQYYAGKIKAAGFPVNALKLIHHYLTMAAQDFDKAYKTLVENPAYFSPILTTDKDGKEILSASKAADENKRLGKFLAKL